MGSKQTGRPNKPEPRPSVPNQAARNTLNDSLQYLKGVGPKRILLLDKLGLQTVRDLLFHFPRRYVERSEAIPIAEAEVDQTVTVCGQIVSRQRGRPRGGRSILTVRIADDSGELDAVWFNAPYLFDNFHEGQRLALAGKLSFYKRPQIANPDFEPLADDADSAGFAGLQPVYALTDGLYQKQLRRIVAHGLEKYADTVEDIFPTTILKAKKLMPVGEAIRQIHFPDSPAKQGAALDRFKYEELFLLQLGMALRRRMLRSQLAGTRLKIDERIDARIRQRFPFTLTAAQERVITTVRADLESDHPMNRLLQGDVGCGKTAVAIYALLAAVANRRQVAFMAPTDLLAEQHEKTLRDYLDTASVRIARLAGGMPKRERAKRLSAIADGQVDVVVGTQALIQSDVAFRNLGLVIVDEQHKFGVLQRSLLREKGISPHVLVMTATPIPRTLSLTVFGDLDVSVIDEMPAGRGGVETFLADSSDKSRRDKALAFVDRKLEQGGQAFFVYPLVSDPDTDEKAERLAGIKSAEAMAAELASGPLGRHGVRQVTGRMPAEQKEKTLTAFRAGEFRVLVATVVIEVGIDIPNATLMVIENAERFGCAQLHQLRGRIGRGSDKAYCILLGDLSAEPARRRLETIVKTNDGFVIAEEDLRQRGPGQFFGTRQHGLPELQVADLIDDYDLLLRTRDDATRLVSNDPALARKACARIRRAVLDKYGELLELVDVG